MSPVERTAAWVLSSGQYDDKEEEEEQQRGGAGEGGGAGKSTEEPRNPEKVSECSSRHPSKGPWQCSDPALSPHPSMSWRSHG